MSDNVGQGGRGRRGTCAPKAGSPARGDGRSAFATVLDGATESRQLAAVERVLGSHFWTGPSARKRAAEVVALWQAAPARHR